MKLLFKYALASVLLLSTNVMSAQNCDIPVVISVDEAFSNVSSEAKSVLETQLQRLALDSNMDISWSNTNFALTAKFDQMGKQVVGGAPAKVVNSYTISLMVVDILNQKLFSSIAIDVNGVGNNETKASIDAIKRLNGKNQKIGNFIKQAKQKIVNYYDMQLGSIIKQAETKASMKEYEEALSLLMVVPTCCNGYDSAIDIAKKIYKQYLDTYNLSLLNKAKALWASNPTAEGSGEVVAILGIIDPDAKCYKDAMTLISEVSKVTRSDLDFEIRTKYKDDIELNKLRINAMTEIGKGFAASQPKSIINVIGGTRY